MTTITAKVIADSFNAAGSRLTTLQLKYPAWIHGEVMTHRVMSRNASSNRAIPVKKMIEAIRADLAVPIHWGKNQKGMQAFEECNALVPFNIVTGIASSYTRENAWLQAMEYAINAAEAFDRAGYHKQIVNRLLQPFMHMNVVLSSTKWKNFDRLRDHKDAEPHMRDLATEIIAARNNSEPRLLKAGEWHVPYVNPDEVDWDHSHDVFAAIQDSVARCARVSYMTTENKQSSFSEDVALYNRLVHTRLEYDDLPHASPAEHQAIHYTDFEEGWHHIAPIWAAVGGADIRRFALNGNFSRSWCQFRKLIPDEDGGTASEE